MQNNQQALINFFRNSIKDIDIWSSFFDDILENPEVFSEREASLLAIKEVYQFSHRGTYITETLIERDHYLLWKKVDFEDRRTVLIEAKDLNAAYQLGFLIFARTDLKGGFVFSKELHTNNYYDYPFHHMITDEEKIKELGLEKSSDGYYYRQGSLLGFFLAGKFG